MSRRLQLTALLAVLSLAGCFGGPPPDVPYGRGGAVEGEVVPNDRVTEPVAFDAEIVQSDEHLQQAVVAAVESSDGTSRVPFEPGEGESVYEASQRLHEAGGDGYEVEYRNHTVVVRVLFYS